VGVNARGSWDQIFQIAIISEYASKFDWDQGLLRLGIKKKERRKTTVVKYKLFGIVMLCGLIIQQFNDNCAVNCGNASATVSVLWC